MTKAEIVAAARWALPRLKIGYAVRFDVPANQPGRRILCQAVNAVAYSTFGAGNYRLQSALRRGMRGDGSIYLTRLA